MKVNLFWSLKPEAQAALMQYQHDNYGEKLEILELSTAVTYSVQLESLEKIEKLMRQPPSRSHE